MKYLDLYGKQLIEELLAYAIKNSLVKEADIDFTRNRLLEHLGLDEPLDNLEQAEAIQVPEYPYSILNKILDYSYNKGILKENTLTYRDLLDTKIMGVFMPRPSEIEDTYYQLMKQEGARAATEYFYKLCLKSNYIRMERIMKNIKWTCDSPYGQLEITINMTKPEKDPKEIAAFRKAKQTGYPKCMLCIENVGYAGRLNFPARQTLRTVPVSLNKEKWHLQYSPYVYYREHCIVLSQKHVPMKLSRDTFVRLFDFLDLHPHYFIGSNADLPIVGGSILNHDHFQGGNYVFPMEKASIEYKLIHDSLDGIQAGVVNWPMSVIRLSSYDREILIDIANHILVKWRDYEDKEAEIIPYSTEKGGQAVAHNTITPIARKNKEAAYELDLVLRNNRTNDEHPLGIFHPHKDLHHIKKENIGLIEVMGLFILPSRLNQELGQIKAYLAGEKTSTVDLAKDDHPLNHHYPWIKYLLEKHGSSNDNGQAEDIIRAEVGQKCQRVLSDAGVFKTDNKGRQAFNKFLASCGLRPEKSKQKVL